MTNSGANTTITTSMPFPAIEWWCYAINASDIIVDINEHYRKMTFRNRYRISGSNNPVLLSIPLQSGRNQRIPMKDVMIFNEDNWQVRHWRTLVSVYKRTPFFEYYEASLQSLFEQEYIHLVDFNTSTLQWVQKQLKLKLLESFSTDYKSHYPNSIIDLREIASFSTSKLSFPKYYQIFEERIGFQENLSILDLLFSEGPNTLNWLKENF